MQRFTYHSTRFFWNMSNDSKKNTMNCQQQQEKEGKQFPNQDAVKFQKGLFQEGIESVVVASVKKVAAAEMVRRTQKEVGPMTHHRYKNKPSQNQ